MKKKNKRKRPSLAAKFFKTLITILVVYFIILAVYIAYTYVDDDPDDDYFSNLPEKMDFFSTTIPERTNVLILGVDSEAVRTDTMMVASYNSVSGKLSIISIPRDTLVSVPDDRWEVMCENIPELRENYSSRTKINGIYNYAGEKHRYEYTVLQVEELMGIDIDYYLKVDCEAFRYIVDSIGGIDYDVPMDMYYEDPAQDLYIDLEAGMQHLDGDKAEQLVRYRKGYDSQDLARMETQQSFMKVFLKTALSKESILSNPSAYITALFKYVDTDIKISDALKYMKEFSKFSTDNMDSYTLPGDIEMIHDTSYYVIDDEEMSEMIYSIFNAPSEDSSIQYDSFEKRIQILNGGYKSGFAMRKKIRLEADGYNVESIADSPYEKDAQTKIYVSENGYGNDLVKYFDNAKVIVYPDKTEDFDIVIVTGSEESDESDRSEQTDDFEE